MLAQFGAKFAVVHLVACKIYYRRASVGAGLALLIAGSALSGCAVPIALKGQDPADPGTKVARVGYQPTIAPYTSLRPTVPGPWRKQNEDVAPSPKSGH